MKGEKLTALPLTHTTWKAWKQAHPETRVLSTDTGFRRNYGRDPYAGYAGESELYFPVRSQSARYHPEERVLGLEVDGRFKAYPFAELSRTGWTELTDRFADHQIRIRFDAVNQSAQAFDTDGNQIAGIVGFWFAWFAFHPQSEVFTAVP